MARMKFLCDAERCIECNGCVTACKQENEVPWGVNRRRVVTHQRRHRRRREVDLGGVHALLRRALHGGVPGRLLLPHRGRRGAARQGPVHRLRLLLLRLPVRRAAVPAGGRLRPARQDGQVHVLRRRPRGDKSDAEFKKYGRNRLAEGKLPACAEMCSTKALLGGDGDVIADIYRERVLRRGKGSRSLGLGHRIWPGQAADPAATGAQTMKGICIVIAALSHRVWVSRLAASATRSSSDKQGKYQGKPDSPPVGQRATRPHQQRQVGQRRSRAAGKRRSRPRNWAARRQTHRPVRPVEKAVRRKCGPFSGVALVSGARVALFAARHCAGAIERPAARRRPVSKRSRSARRANRATTRPVWRDVRSRRPWPDSDHHPAAAKRACWCSPRAKPGGRSATAR